ncbi:MAG: hypothetical protein ACRYFU_04030 [Janthinobacterium lividum]
MGMGAVLFGLLFFLAIAIFFVYLVWRIFAKAGLPGPLALLWLVPGIGWIIALCILAFSEWKVVPARSAYGDLPPAYPPPAYPATVYPPTNPPQL